MMFALGAMLLTGGARGESTNHSGMVYYETPNDDNGALSSADIVPSNASGPIIDASASLLTARGSIKIGNNQTISGVCPAAFIPPIDGEDGEQWQSPPIEVREYPQKTIRILPGDTRANFVFNSPDGISMYEVRDGAHVVGNVQFSNNNTAATVPLIQGAHGLEFRTNCVVYQVQVVVEGPEIKVETVSLDSDNSVISYELNASAGAIEVRYEIVGCESPEALFCYGFTEYSPAPQFGDIDISVLADSINKYFANYHATKLIFTVTPSRSGYETTDSAQLAFNLQSTL